MTFHSRMNYSETSVLNIFYDVVTNTALTSGGKSRKKLPSQKGSTPHRPGTQVSLVQVSLAVKRPLHLIRPISSGFVSKFVAIRYGLLQRRRDKRSIVWGGRYAYLTQ